MGGDRARVCVFGGSFNPPHRGHEDLVATLLARDLVDEILVVPVYEHPFGKPLAPFDDRLEMCRIAFARHGDRVRISPIERELGGTSYTVRTLEAIRERRPQAEILLVVGADTLEDLQHWREFDRVRALATLLVVPRSGAPVEGALDLPAPTAVSSTEIRDRLARGEPVRGLLGPGVERYVRSRRLYGAAAEPMTTAGGDE